MPIWNIPFPRNPFFTARDQELERLHTQLHQRQTAIIGQMQSISGLGGIGKTQLAVEYVYRHYDEYQYVLWARAESVEALTSSFVEIARLLDLPEKDVQEQGFTIQAVKRWLQQQHGWLMILDNADTPDLLPVFLPSTVGGHMLITTRAADLSAQIAGLAHPLVVETLSDEQGSLFLLHRSDLLALNATLDQAETHTKQLAIEISYELGGLPLALDQVGAYLKVTGSSLAAYQQIYRHHRARLLSDRRGADHPDSVTTTWDISFQHVEATNSAAADLLRLCAFLAPGAIPEELLTKGAGELGDVLAPVVADTYHLDQVITALRAYSLISRNPHTHTLTVHRLVQAILYDSMATEMKQQWMQRAVHAVETAYPGSDFANWSAYERLLPHVLVCIIWIKHMRLVTPSALRLLNQAGIYLIGRGRYVEAEPLLTRALAISEQELGATHPNTASGLHNLAGLYWEQGRYVEAEPLLKRALAINEQESGASHPNTASTLNGLAELYRGQGRYAEAEPLYKRALAICEQELGTTDPDTALSLNNLAILYYNQGRYTEAEPLYKRALAICEQELGASHPKTAFSLNNLATLYKSQGRYTEAEPLYKRALAICEQELGATHPDMAFSLNNLAVLYYNQGRYTEAEPLYKRALAICEQELGASHPDMAFSLNNLAALYDNQEKYVEAEPLLVRALTIRQQELGATHPDTASSLHNLAALYYNQEKYVEAEPLLVRALAIREQELGTSHLDTASSVSNLACLYENQGKYREAEPLRQRALIIYEQQLGLLHPDTVSGLNNLAFLYEIRGKYVEAEPLLVRALTIRQQELGATHLDTASSLSNLATLYHNQGRYADATSLFQQALVIRKHTLGLEHPDTAQSLWWLAVLAEQQQSYQEAKLLYECVLVICERTLGSEHSLTKCVQQDYTALLSLMK